MLKDTTLWIVSDAEEFWYSDVIGASSPEDAARKYLAASKVMQLEEIAADRKHYDELIAAKVISDPWETSGFRVNVVLPTQLYVVPLNPVTTYHDRYIRDERKDRAQAFHNMWNWDQIKEVRL